jgi:hypothetical protein
MDSNLAKQSCDHHARELHKIRDEQYDSQRTPMLYRVPGLAILPGRASAILSAATYGEPSH